MDYVIEGVIVGNGFVVTAASRKDVKTMMSVVKEEDRIIQGM